MDMALTEQVIANAKFAKNAVVEIMPGHDSGGPLWEYFHLRPTEAGIAIVSNHPRYPMYFAETEKDALKTKLQALERDALPLLVRGALNQDEIAALAGIIEGAGFVQGPLEPMKVAMRQTPEHLQALFITGMIHGGAEYGGVRFLASDLDVGGNSVDVVGYKDGTLYLFEIKKEDAAAAYGKLRACRESWDAGREALDKFMAAYPRTACKDMVEVHEIRQVAVLRHSMNAGGGAPEASGADTWLFEPALAFRKISGK